MTIPPSTMFRSALGEFQPDLSGFDLHAVGLQIDAGRQAHGGARGEVEAPAVFGALDDFALDIAAGEMNRFVSAKPVGREIAILGVAENRVGLSPIVEAKALFALDLIGGA